MRQHELEEWLRGSEDRGTTAADIALLGADTGSVTEAVARSIGFVLAVLRDIYSDDAAVWRWLSRPRSELGYARAADLLLAGEGARIEALATYQWNVAQGDLAGSGVSRMRKTECGQTTLGRHIAP